MLKPSKEDDPPIRKGPYPSTFMEHVFLNPGNKPTLSAGHLVIDHENKVAYINGDSGHFKPTHEDVKDTAKVSAIKSRGYKIIGIGHDDKVESEVFPGRTGGDGDMMEIYHKLGTNEIDNIEDIVSDLPPCEQCGNPSGYE